MLKAWLQEKDIQSVAAALKKAGIEAKLLVSGVLEIVYNKVGL